jgi:hypothetical protein
MCVMKIRRVEGDGVTVRMWAPVEWLDDTTKQRWSWNKLYNLKPDEICTLCNYPRTWSFFCAFYFSFLIIKKESSYTNTILFSHTSSRLVCWFVYVLFRITKHLKFILYLSPFDLERRARKEVIIFPFFLKKRWVTKKKRGKKIPEVRWSILSCFETLVFDPTISFICDHMNLINNQSIQKGFYSSHIHKYT